MNPNEFALINVGTVEINVILYLIISLLNYNIISVYQYGLFWGVRAEPVLKSVGGFGVTSVTSHKLRF